jgi:hypothetical protein
LFLGSIGFASEIDVKTDSSEDLKVTSYIEMITKNNQLVAKTCYYAIYDGRGERIGTLIMKGVPDDEPCGSSLSLSIALQLWDEAMN